ncbi:PIG-L deacetylase family protein [Acholeplasma equifetale]|uniref:PIG-L deacetylase family protein n=1 Tax=Acholeplasma equifetale TaxID=264634 RepID=UPI0004799719|nr:PIG-L family deacetylase [Acholeplasma equifetale]
MQKYNEKTKFFVPDNVPLEEAIKRTTHMAIMAHHDDIEIAAYDGILKCFKNPDQWFFGVVVTNGSGSSRGGKYKNYTDAEMTQVRVLEQQKAAVIGEYGLQGFINATSAETKDKDNQEVVLEMYKMLMDAQPKVLYTHNLADKHDTHIGVVTKVIKALRMMPKELRPKAVYGCEVWRDLDWLNDDEKVAFNVSGNPHLANALIEIFDSQIDGAKRYDLATAGRRYANATYAVAHAVDAADSVIYGMDLTPLIEDDNLDVAQFISDAIDRFKKDVQNKITRML